MISKFTKSLLRLIIFVLVIHLAYVVAFYKALPGILYTNLHTTIYYRLTNLPLLFL